MSPDPTSTIRDAIESGRFGDLIGLEESLTFEAKGATPYKLDEPPGRYELAKDVSALANSAGGFLLVGLRTQASEVEQTDVVSALDPIPATDFPVAKIQGIIREYISPPIAGLRVVWLPTIPADGTGIGVIEVPVQSEEAKPYIVCKVNEGESKLKQIVFGYCRRVGPDSVPHDASTILNALRQGMNPLSQRLTGVEQKLGLVLEMLAESQQPTVTQTSPAAVNELLANRIQKIIGA